MGERAEGWWRDRRGGDVDGRDRGGRDGCMDGASDAGFMNTEMSLSVTVPHSVMLLHRSTVSCRRHTSTSSTISDPHHSQATFTLLYAPLPASHSSRSRSSCRYGRTWGMGIGKKQRHPFHNDSNLLFCSQLWQGVCLSFCISE